MTVRLVSMIHHPAVPAGVDSQGRKLVVDYTDVVIEYEGRHYMSRLQGLLSWSESGYLRAEFERRQRPGFYRVNG